MVKATGSKALFCHGQNTITFVLFTNTFEYTDRFPDMKPAFSHPEFPMELNPAMGCFSLKQREFLVFLRIETVSFRWKRGWNFYVIMAPD